MGSSTATLSLLSVIHPLLIRRTRTLAALRLDMVVT